MNYKSLPVTGKIDPNNRYHAGGGGLVGTLPGLLPFCMLARGGQIEGDRRLSRETEGRPILSSKTMELMASNHGGQLPIVISSWEADVRGFGLGVRVLDKPAEASILVSRISARGRLRHKQFHRPCRMRSQPVPVSARPGSAFRLVALLV